MKKFSVSSFQFSVLLLALCLGVSVVAWQSAAPVFAQEKSPAPTASVPAPAQEQPGVAALPAPVASAKFLAEYDKFLTLVESRNAADRKRAEYEAAVKVLDEQLGELRQSLLGQIPPGSQWDAAKRIFIKRPELPAKEKEKP